MSSNEEGLLKISVRTEDQSLTKEIESSGALVIYRAPEAGSEEQMTIGVNLFGEFNPAELLGLCKAIQSSVVPNLLSEARERLVNMGLTPEKATLAICEVLADSYFENKEDLDGNT